MLMMMEQGKRNEGGVGGGVAFIDDNWEGKEQSWLFPSRGLQ